MFHKKEPTHKCWVQRKSLNCENVTHRWFLPFDLQWFQSLELIGWVFAEYKAISVAIFYIGPKSKLKSRKWLCDFLSSTKTSLNCFSLCSIRNVSLHCNSSTKLSDCLVSNGRYLTHFSSASCFILIDNIWASNNTCSSEFQKTLFKFLKMQYW